MRKDQVKSVIRVMVVAFVLAVVFRSYIFASYVVDGKSMEPTLHDGNLLMVNKVIYDLKDINRFDVIVFHANKQEDYVKRVIGEPGDHIAYKDDKLYINGKKVEESYLKPYRKKNEILTKDFTLEEVTDGAHQVPEGKLFVLGDNRNKSLDSRYFGFIDKDQVVGKVDIIYWPMSNFAFN